MLILSNNSFFNIFIDNIVLYFSVIERKESPKFVKKLDNYEIDELDEARFEVIVTGRPKPNVVWFVFKFFLLIY